MWIKEENNMFSEKYENCFGVSKTLKFKLLPIGKTLENIEKDEILKIDYKKQQDYLKLKEIGDRFHRNLINQLLESITLNWEDYGLLLRENKLPKEKIKEKFRLAKELKEQIVDAFRNNQEYPLKELFDSKKFLDHVHNTLNDLNDKLILKEFKGFTTYLTSYCETRKNIYGLNGLNISVSIPYRIVDENFPIFISNLVYFKKYSERWKEQIAFLDQKLDKKFGTRHIKFEQMFTDNGFNHCLSQSGIDYYNAIIGGFTLNDGIKVQGLSEILNQYRQQNKDEISHAVNFTKLKKQILSDHESISFHLNGITNDKEIHDLFNDMLSFHVQMDTEMYNLLETTFKSDDLLITQEGIRTLSHRLFYDYAEIEERIKSAELSSKTKKSKTAKNSSKQKQFPSQTIQRIRDVLQPELTENQEIELKINQFIYEGLEQFKNNKGLLSSLAEYTFEDSVSSLKNNSELIEKIKNNLDSISKFKYSMKWFDFSNLNILEPMIKEYCRKLTRTYDLVRNYVTKKPYSTSKFKLNFRTPSLLTGWSYSKESDYLSILLLKDGKYYLGIINSTNKVNFMDLNQDSQSKDNYQKMQYYLMKDPDKTFGKILVKTKDIQEHFKHSTNDFEYHNEKFYDGLVLSKKIYDNYESGLFKKPIENDKEAKEALYLWIDFIKNALTKYKNWKDNLTFSHLKDTKEYTSLSEFYHDILIDTQSIHLKNISVETIHNMVENGQLYLFQIYNKDFAEGTTGRENLHTIYFKSLFHEYNLKNNIIQLNGNGEMFYRPASINEDSKIVHKKGSYLLNKVMKDGQPVPRDVYQAFYAHLNMGKPLDKSFDEYKEKLVFKKARYDITKDNRYTKPSFEFHVPIKINYVSKDMDTKSFNQQVNQDLKTNDVHILGIDRGTRNLITVTLLDSNRHIILQKSLNLVSEKYGKNGQREVDYYQRLNQRELERDQQRKSWSTIESIKELKDGYISQAVNEICKLVLEYKAIIVMEDLDTFFKRKETKIEKQVYQKFELALAKKLNLIVLKTAKTEEQGSVFHALQLTPPVNLYSDIGKQCGIIFYVNPGYTSKIDPTTGFVDVVNRRKVKKEPNLLIENISRITYDQDKDVFTIDFSYSKMPVYAMPYRKDWRVYTYGERIINSKVQGKYQEKYIQLTQEFKKFFEDAGIRLDDDLLAELRKLNSTKKCLFVDLFLRTLQLRNSSVQKKDYILSPVQNKDETFYDSRNGKLNLPIDGDTNGAYHIARKGMMLINRIRFDEDPNLYISNVDWFASVQE